MTRGHRLAAVLAGAAAILLIGRGGAVVYADHAWYAALGASRVWDAKVRDVSLIYGVALAAGTLFALLNILAVRSSVVALVVPKRVGTLEIGEEVPASRLFLVATGISLFAAAVGTFATPSWTTLALWRAGVHFNETDPYFGLDLSHYVAWLPLESAAYVWAFVVFAVVALLVLTLYSLTPSLSWGRAGVRVTAHVRRHVTVLAAILLLLTAWGFHLETYHLMVSGRGLSSVFTRADRDWLVPLDIALSLGTVGAAVVLLAAGWLGHTLTALVTVSVVIICAVAAKVVVPWAADTAAALPSRAKLEAPYTTTRKIYTDRAFPVEAVPPAVRYAADPSVIAAAPRVAIRGGLPGIVYPGATGTALLPDPAGRLHAPRLGRGVARLMQAWADQNLQLFEGKLPASTAVVSHRDVRERVRLVAPPFAQAVTIGWRPTPGGIYWLVDLYSTSEHYPLSEPQVSDRSTITYRHHVATAYVNGMTGAVTVVPDASADAIATAWFARYGGPYVAPAPPADLTHPIPVAPPGGAATPADSAFRARLAEIYIRMRTALTVGDLRAFGEAFDSLGIVLGARQ